MTIDQGTARLQKTSPARCSPAWGVPGASSDSFHAAIIDDRLRKSAVRRFRARWSTSTIAVDESSPGGRQGTWRPMLYGIRTSFTVCIRTCFTHSVPEVTFHGHGFFRLRVITIGNNLRHFWFGIPPLSDVRVYLSASMVVHPTVWTNRATHASPIRQTCPRQDRYSVPVAFPWARFLSPPRNRNR